MRPKPPAPGFAIVTAIFLVVALATLAAAILYFSWGQQISNTQDIQGSRVLAAARAGTEWAAAYIDAHNTCPTSPSNLSFEGFVIEVACASATYTDEGASLKIYALTSTAKAGGSVGGLAYVERQVTATLAK